MHLGKNVNNEKLIFALFIFSTLWLRKVHPKRLIGVSIRIQLRINRLRSCRN